MFNKRLIGHACLAAGLLMSPLALAQSATPAAPAAAAPSIVRTPLQKWEIPDGKPMDVNTVQVDIVADGSSGRHTHAGAELAYVVSGTVLIKQDGVADVTLNAGDSAIVLPPGSVHEAIAQGGPARLVVTYVTERGQPLAAPAP